MKTKTNTEKYKVVDWRFWRWPGLARKWYQNYQDLLDGCVRTVQEHEQALERIERLREDELAAHRSVNGLLRELKEAPVSDELLRAAFQGVHAGTPWWRMLNHVLERKCAEEDAAASAPELTPEVRSYRAGGAAVLREFRLGMHALNLRSQPTSVGANAPGGAAAAAPYRDGVGR